MSDKRFDLDLEAGRASQNYWQDLWRYRELFYFLAWRDILVRYKQTMLGVAWAIIRPFLTMLIFTILFNKMVKLDAPGSTPYALFVFAAMLPWQFFSSALSESSNSLIANSNLISKVYFPRLIVPAGSVVTSFVDFSITLVLMAAMMLWYGYTPDWKLGFLPFFVLLAVGAALGAGLWLCALNVKYRDIRYVIPFMMQLGLYVSPVGFSSDIVPAPWRLIYAFNPLVGIIEGFRWTLLRGEAGMHWPSLLTSTITVIACCASGLWYFRKLERTLADSI